MQREVAREHAEKLQRPVGPEPGSDQTANSNDAGIELPTRTAAMAIPIHPILNCIAKISDY